MRREDEIEMVSLFECGTEAWDISKLTKKQTEAFMDAEDLEGHACEHDIDRIEVVYAVGNNGSDNDWCVIEEQDTHKSIVKDVNGREIYDGGLEEYMGSFGDIYAAVQYWDGSNWQLSIEDE